MSHLGRIDLQPEEKAKLDQISNIKGDILITATLLDAKLSAILADCLIIPEKRLAFFAHVAMDEQFSTALKIRVLNRFSIFETEYKSLKKDLERIFQIRNIIAHSPDVRLSNPDLKVFRGLEKDGETAIYEDLTDFKKEFDILARKIAPGLQRVHEKINTELRTSK